MRITGFKVLSFDCYGTLIDRDSGIWSALKPLLAGGHTGLSREEALAAFDRQEAALEASSTELPYSEILAQAHRALAKEWAVLCSEDEHIRFGHSVPKWPAFADAPAALQYFGRYFEIVALMNGDRHSLADSARLLEARFDLICTAEEIGSYMPDQRGIRHVIGKLAKLGYLAGEILHVGASPQRDLAPAAAAGLATAWIDRRSAGGDTDKVALPEGVRFGLRFRSIAHLVKAHQEELRA
ncbi:MAG: HAD family hydrolase [Acetobacteraceae bacterium]